METKKKENAKKSRKNWQPQGLLLFFQNQKIAHGIFGLCEEPPIRKNGSLGPVEVKSRSRKKKTEPSFF